jgi:hypothetical protein
MWERRWSEICFHIDSSCSASSVLACYGWRRTAREGCTRGAGWPDDGERMVPVLMVALLLDAYWGFLGESVRRHLCLVGVLGLL